MKIPVYIDTLKVGELDINEESVSLTKNSSPQIFFNYENILDENNKIVQNVLTSCSIIINSNTYLYQPPYSYQNPYFNLDIEKDLIRKEIKQIKKVKEKNQDIIPKTPIEQLEI